LPHPERDGDLSEFMRWLTLTHTQRWHAQHHTQGTGPLYQGRVKAFPAAKDEHCLRVLRYVERNPLRAGLARNARRCRWSSLGRATLGLAGPPLETGPVAKPEPWQEWLDQPETEAELTALRGPRRAVRRGIVAAADGQTSGPGVESAARGPSVEIRKSPAKLMTPDPFSWSHDPSDTATGIAMATGTRISKNI
jgi:hypothetical protein